METRTRKDIEDEIKESQQELKEKQDALEEIKESIDNCKSDIVYDADNYDLDDSYYVEEIKDDCENLLEFLDDKEDLESEIEDIQEDIKTLEEELANYEEQKDDFIEIFINDEKVDSTYINDIFEVSKIHEIQRNMFINAIMNCTETNAKVEIYNVTYNKTEIEEKQLVKSVVVNPNNDAEIKYRNEITERKIRDIKEILDTMKDLTNTDKENN